MKRKQFTYRLFLTAVFLPIALLSNAELYHELSDSIRLAVRLKTYLLIHPEEFTDSELDSLVLRDIPLAFHNENQDPLQVKRIKRLTDRQHRIPVVTPQAPQQSGLSVLVLIKPAEFDNVQLLSATTDSLFHDSLFTFNELLYVDPGPEKISDPQLFLRLWYQSGKLPNLIEATPANYRDIARVVNFLNATNKFFGVVRSGEKLLGHVSWKGYAHSKTNGYFCFPLMAGTTVPFVPYKPGFRFSPDIIYDSPGNRGFWKEYKALGVSSDFELTDHFVFGKRIMNLKRKNDPEIINNQVKLVPDKQLGTCAFFHGRAYLDAGTQSIEALKPNFTVTAWIKPAQTGTNNSILGKGTNFVLKLHDGKLTFTVQGVKDYISNHSQIPLNKWSFIALVHSAYENRIRFYVNGRLTDQFELMSSYTESDHSLLIGSNLWEEFFIGSIGKIKIWQRELNEEEIMQQFKEPDRKNQHPVSAFLPWALLILPVVAGSVLLRRLFKRRSPLKQELSQPAMRTVYAEKILCFGGLRVINSEGTDVSRKFSPKLKQLFILILLYSVNGQKGITTKRLSEILWPGMSPQHSKNTRGTNIQNLKAILASCENLRLVFQDKLWFIERDNAAYCDYDDALQQLDQLEKWTPDHPIPFHKLKELFVLLKGGTLFPNMSASWLDPYVSKISDRIIELGLNFMDHLDENRHASLIFELADVISLHDPLNEPALNKKLCLLTRQGKLSLARTVYDQFSKLYQELYQEPYPVDFKNTTQHEV